MLVEAEQEYNLADSFVAAHASMLAMHAQT